MTSEVKWRLLWALHLAFAEARWLLYRLLHNASLLHLKDLCIGTAHNTQTFFKHLLEISGIGETREADFSCIAILWFPLFYAVTKIAVGAESSSTMFYDIQHLRRGRIVCKNARYINENLQVFFVNVTTVNSINCSGSDVWNYSIKNLVCRYPWRWEWDRSYVWQKPLLFS